MKTVIIAAGNGSRLLKESSGIPKTLLPFGRGTILSTILKSFSQCEMEDFVIVTGYESGKISDYLEKNDYFGYNITFVENRDWRRGNGISVLVAEAVVKNEVFILSMADHIVSPRAIKRLIKSESNKNLLLVDTKIEDIFDIDDATKVYVDNDTILQIGKNLSDYNGIDCGVFRLNNHYFDSMREQLKTENESNSAAVNGLIKNDDMAAVFVEEHEYWIDIDTPEAYQYALKKFDN